MLVGMNIYHAISEREHGPAVEDGTVLHSSRTRIDGYCRANRVLMDVSTICVFQGEGSEELMTDFHDLTTVHHTAALWYKFRAKDRISRDPFSVRKENAFILETFFETVP